jgi:hypothetical protein
LLFIGKDGQARELAGQLSSLAIGHLPKYTFNMAQITLYVPDHLAERIRREARRAGKSLSAYMVDLVAGRTHASGWPAGFARLYGSCDLGEIEDAPPRELEPL